MSDEIGPEQRAAELLLEERRVALEERREERLSAERERELRLAEKQAEPRSWTEGLSNPLTVAVVAGTLALFGNGVIALVNNIGELTLARQQEQAELVLAALGTDNVEKARENLRLLAEAELITSDERRANILSYLASLEEGQGPGGLGGDSVRIPDFALRALTERSSLLRTARFERAIDDGLPAIAVLGDGWLNYPLLLTDIGDHLTESFAVFNAAAPGSCIDDTISTVPALPDGLEQVVVSVGLCELIAENGIASSFISPSDGIDPFGSETFRRFGALEASLASLLDAVIAHLPNASIVIHGYDYPRLSPDGPLSQSLAARGLTGDQAQHAMQRAIDELNDIVARLSSSRLQVTYADARALLGDEDWYDEIYPSSAGFSLVSDLINRRLGN